MSAILGPFQPDRNLSVASLAYEDRLWVILRPALSVPRANETLGLLELRGVRCSRERSISDAELSDLMGDADPSFWALESTESEYLEDSLDDGRNPVRDPSAYKCFVVMNGWHRVIEAVAKSAVCRVLEGEAFVAITKLMVTGVEEPFET